MRIPPESADEIELLHREMSAALERIAWAILRDWPLASDAVQDAFMLLTEKWPEIPLENRRGWLVRTVQLVSQNLRRKQARDQQLPAKLMRDGLRHQVEELDKVGDRAIHVSSSSPEEARLTKLAAAVAALPETQRRVVELRLQSEVTFADISKQLDIPLGTVLSRMRLALEKLRRLLD